MELLFSMWLASITSMLSMIQLVLLICVFNDIKIIVDEMQILYILK